MASSDGFYMTLPADGSADVYPNNTLSTFTNRLVQPVDLSEGEWEVGLMEMMFPTTLDNISQEESWFDLLICQGTQKESDIQEPDESDLGRFILSEIYELKHDRPGGRVLLKEDADEVERVTLVPWIKSTWTVRHGWTHHFFKVYRVHFRSGSYPEPDGLIEEINEGIKRCMWKIWQELGGLEGPTEMKLEYSRNTKKIKYIRRGKQFYSEHPYSIRFPAALGYKLGFGPEAFLQGDDALGDYELGGLKEGETFIPHTRWLNVDYSAPNVVDLYDNLHEKYVYCDIIDSQLVGGNSLKLLKVISTPPQRNVQGASGRWDPMTIQYVKLGKKYFETVEIEVRTTLGKPFPFTSGKLVVVLHFRRIY